MRIPWKPLLLQMTVCQSGLQSCGPGGVSPRAGAAGWRRMATVRPVAVPFKAVVNIQSQSTRLQPASCSSHFAEQKTSDGGHTFADLNFTNLPCCFV